MERLNRIVPVYCEPYIPRTEEMVFGELYISKKFGVAVHLCPCGCGGLAVTPIGEGEWSLVDVDGKVTLRPSVANWNGERPPHAHYYITNNEVQWL